MTRARGALVWLLGAALAVSSACGPGGSAPDPGSAQGRVEALERALVDADSAAVIEIVEDRRYAVSTALLTDAVLERGALAGQEVELERTDTDLDSVRYALRLPDQESRPWLEPELRRSGELVGSALPTIKLRGPGVTSVSISGVQVDVGPLPGEGQSFYLPPGEYDVGVGGADRYVDHGPTQRVDTRSLRSDGLDFPARLRPPGRAQVDRAVRSFVKRCTEPLRGNRPAGCPARKAFVGGLVSSRWTLDSYPRTSIEAGAVDWQLSTPDPPLGRMTGVVRDRETGATEQVTDTVPFAFSGTIAVRGDELVIRIPSY